MEFRSRLLATLRAIQPVLEEPGVLVLGSEVPNLLQPAAASTLVVSQDVDVAVPISAHARVKSRLGALRDLSPAPEEPSVWIPATDAMIEVNFIGMDPTMRDPGAAYVLEDPVLPLMVFGGLSFIRAGEPLQIEGVTIPVPRPAGLMIEKLLTDRSGEKGERDLLVVLGLMLVANEVDLEELEQVYRTLSPELRHVLRSNLAILSLTAPREGMPDPRPERRRLALLLRRLEAGEEGGR